MQMRVGCSPNSIEIILNSVVSITICRIQLKSVFRERHPCLLCLCIKIAIFSALNIFFIYVIYLVDVPV